MSQIVSATTIAVLMSWVVMTLVLSSRVEFVEHRHVQNQLAGFVLHQGVETEIGVVEIGPRKRVVHIGVQNLLDVESPEILFEKEDVTKTERCVHAWDKDKVVEYLRAILVSASSRRSSGKTDAQK